jgi:hypothetical protein
LFIERVPTDVLIKWCNENPDKRYLFAAGVCKLFDKQDNEKTPSKISDTATTLFDAAPDKEAIIKIFLRRFYPSTWMGSLADILETRLPLLDQLVVNDHDTVKSAITTGKVELRKLIDSERAREKEEERSRNSSFE